MSAGSDSDAIYIAIAAVYVVVFFDTAIVCWLKGKRLWAIFGLLTFWHVIPAIRLAKPGSWWAKRFYGPEKTKLSLARFAPADDGAGQEPESRAKRQKEQHDEVNRAFGRSD